jgi:hypothetical protein
MTDLTREALRSFAADLRDASQQLLATLGPPADGPAEPESRETLDELRLRLLRTVPGKMQKAVLGLAGLYSAQGMTTDAVRRALDLSEPARVFQPLQRLGTRGVVEEVPGVEPKHWRVAERHRRRLPADG